MQYDAFREDWSDSMPILYGGCEAITTHFGLNPTEYSVQDIAITPPDNLRPLGNGEPNTNAVYLEAITCFSRWYDLETKTDYLAERFKSGNWCLATLSKDSFTWNIEGTAFTEPDILSRYMEHPEKRS